ncbi:invasion associated locus B family protein [Rhizobium lemnae]|uniref:Invasion associated locus B family protein n=1 Tax=Rhizobium lemnae TaxID=1214924 RepID=A0ABV8E728_9HYPH|nr:MULTISPECIES: invasion associated locus B family protein [Rhizobium]MCJ8508255.1 invasion associated locus B family protein [Rhizobium lemnae]
MKFPTLRAATMAALLPLALAAQLVAEPVQAQTSSGDKQPRPTQSQSPAPAQPAPASPSAGSAPRTSPPQTGSPAAPGTVRESHGAWSILCDKPAGSSVEQCAMMQNVIADDRPEVGLSVVVLKTVDRKARILRILAPLGVLLKDGMDLFVDGNNIGRAYFTRCFSEGCYVEVEIDDELMKILRAGKNAVFALRESVDQDRVGIPIELSGFAQGYDALP